MIVTQGYDDSQRIVTLGYGGVSAPTPPAPTPTLLPQGTLARKKTRLAFTITGEPLLDCETFMLTPDGHIFFNFNSLYVSMDKQILLNLNRNKPIYLIIGA